MASKEIEIDLNDPYQAREFIRTFKYPSGDGEPDRAVERLTLLNGRRIEFSRMTDIEAVLAAKAITHILAEQIEFRKRH